MSRIDALRVREEELALIDAKRELLEGSPACAPGSGEKHAGKCAGRTAVDNESWRRRLFGLALSGGGIRSATFNLGILQSLAKHNLLRRIDYLSTVSGGGYIGGWFTSLLQREHYRRGMESEPGEAEKEHAIDIVTRRIHPDYAKTDDCNNPEDPAITHLRSYSNYLTPKLGFLSADTWALITTYLRNVLLMQTILVSFIVVLLLLPRLASYFVASHTFDSVIDILAIFVPVTLAVIILAGRSSLADGVAGFNSGLLRRRTLESAAILLSIGGIVLFIALKTEFDIIASIVGLGVIAAWFVGQNLAAVSDTDPAKPNPHGTVGLFCSVLFPVIFITYLTTVWLQEGARQMPTVFPFPGDDWYRYLSLTLCAVAIYMVLWYVASLSSLRAFTSGWVPLESRSTWARRWMTIVISGAFASTVLGAAMFGIANLMSPEPNFLTALWAPPLVLLSVLLTATIHIGLAASAFKSQQREWLSRLGAWALIISLVWLAFSTIALIGPFLVKRAFELNFGELLTAGWVGTTIAGLLAARGNKQGAPAGWVRQALIRVAPYVFIAGLVVLLAAAVQWALRLVAGLEPARSYWNAYLNELTLTSDDPAIVSLGILVFAALAAVFSYRFDINEFSLHHMYENRLTRCYLGATTECRYANPFTGFSMQDDMPLWASKTKKKGKDAYHLGLTEEELKELSFKDRGLAEKAEELAAGYPGPYPLINTAINLVGGERLAWQERKAASFLLSPLYCGFQLAGQVGGDGRCRCERPNDKQKCNFCIQQFLADIEATGKRTEEFLARQCPFSSRSIKECIDENHDLQGQEHSAERDYFKPTRHFAAEPVPSSLTLGDAIATSGAAASPSMGYRTTPALAFLLSVFNIRLGRWIGNPLEGRWKKSGPGFALFYLLMEVFGLTNKKANFVYLSDGGHFDNLGLYELVRRRCRYVIACDAGADPEYSFEDLANATRKCRIDFGVNIEIDVSEIQSQDERGDNAANCALGKIYYPDGKTGELLYIKASRPANLPADVMQYAMEHSSFPHQVTVDQFFSESQFESYRLLGRHIGDNCLADSVEQSQRKGKINIPELFRRLGEQWYKRSTAIEANFAQHSKKLDSLFRRLQSDPELAFLDKQFYPEWRVLPRMGPDEVIRSTARRHREQHLWVFPDSQEEFRAGFYFCNSLIQLAENVYLDLDLEHEHDHPDNSGWMNLFRHWVWSGMFRITWAMSAPTYGRRFRSFCKRRLDLQMGRVSVHRLDPRQFDAIVRLPDDRPPPPVTLNLLERRQIRHIFLRNRGHWCDIYELNMKVRSPTELECVDEQKALLTFNFGYAVVVDGNRLVMFRVQDHLRRMGLGARALKKLFGYYPDLRFEPKDAAGLFGSLKITESEAHRFNSMFEEVRDAAASDPGNTAVPGRGNWLSLPRTLVFYRSDHE